jgi:hypothetical protein
MVQEGQKVLGQLADGHGFRGVIRAPQTQRIRGDDSHASAQIGKQRVVSCGVCSQPGNKHQGRACSHVLIKETKAVDADIGHGIPQISINDSQAASDAGAPPDVKKALRLSI